MRNLLVLAVVALVAEGRRGCEEERAGDDGGEEGEAEEEEGVLGEGFAVAGGEGIFEGCREGLRGKGRHCGRAEGCGCYAVGVQGLFGCDGVVEIVMA